MLTSSARRTRRRPASIGVQLHGANGYLIDQFLQDSTNHRTDEYGGPVENRARLLLEVVDRLVGVWGAGRVGVHLAPRGDSHDMGDSNRLATFTYAARELGRRKIAFICAARASRGRAHRPELKKAFRRRVRCERRLHAGVG